MQRVPRHALMVIIALSGGVARAELGPMPGEEQFKGQMPETDQNVGMGLGMMSVDDDYFVQLVLKSELNLGPVGLGLQIPLNLRVYDKDPKAANDYYGLIRHEDWDETSEYVKVIRYVRLGHKRDDFYLRVGELAADIGHGTIMNRYLNNVDINTFRVGAAFDINTLYGGIETMTSDIGTMMDTGSPDSRLLGTRLYFKPMAIVDPESTLNIFAVGVSVLTDTNAPLELKSEIVDNGFIAVRRPVVEDGNLVPKSQVDATVYGFDVEAEVLNNAVLKLVPYSDLNFMADAGWGWHLGAQASFSMPIGIELTIPVRLEYRNFSADYIPGYFGTFYEIERYNFGLTPLADPNDPPDIVTKAAYARNLKSGKGLQGYYGDLAFDFAGIFQVGAVYEDYIGDDQGLGANLQAFMAVPALEWLQFKAFYARTHIQGTDDILVLDKKSMAVVEARYEMISYVFLVGRLTQRWVLIEDGPRQGDYKGERDYQFGIEASMSF